MGCFVLGSVTKGAKVDIRAPKQTIKRILQIVFRANLDLKFWISLFRDSIASSERKPTGREIPKEDQPVLPATDGPYEITPRAILNWLYTSATHTHAF